MKETFGERFSRIRKQRGLTQEELGEKVGLSGQAVSKWENDASMPDVSLLVNLSEILNVSLDELLGKEQMLTRIVPEEERIDTSNRILRILVNSADGDKITMNLPMALVKAGIQMGMMMPTIDGNNAMANIDFEKVTELVEQGLVGEIVSVDSADGDTIRVFVE